MSRQRKSLFFRPEWLLIGIVLVAANLRAPITGVPPVIEAIQRSFSLSAAQAGFLTASPLIVFAVISLLSPAVARRLGLERGIFLALNLMLIGSIWRVQDSVSALYLGNNLIAVGIALGNVLIPSLIKQYFPQRISVLTAVYSLTMGISSFIISAIAIPLESTAYGWRLALLSIFPVLLICWLVWLPQIRKGARKYQPTRDATTINLFKNRLAWQVTFFLGFNSLVFYILVSWVPSLLISLGYSAAAAANLHGVMQLGSAVAGLVLIPVVRMFHDQRPAVLLSSASLLAGLIGTLAMPGLAWLWVTVAGFGSGAVFVLALSFLGLRSSHSGTAARLGGMAQCLGYLLASIGPFLMGAFYDLTHSWVPMLVFCITVSSINIAFGLAAGRDRKVEHYAS